MIERDAAGTVATDGRCPICGLHHLEPRPFGRPCYYGRLRAALGKLEPTAREDRILRWLAGLDEGTAEPVASLFERLRGPAGLDTIMRELAQAPALPLPLELARLPEPICSRCRRRQSHHAGPGAVDHDCPDGFTAQAEPSV